MIRPEDKFRSLCGCFFTSEILITRVQYRVQKWHDYTYAFYMNMYSNRSVSNTTYYAELIQRRLYAEKMS